MKTSVKFASLVMAATVMATISIAAFAQEPAPSKTISPHTTSPAAYVYVSSATDHVQINAYLAAANGKLTAVAGSPFAENGAYMAVDGKWLFSTDSINIYSFSIASNGALTQVSSINAQGYNGYTDGGPVNLFLDHTGTSLYDEDVYGNEGANNTYQFFDINRESGALTYLGATSTATPNFETPLSFVGNNQYAFGAACYHGYQDIYGFTRSGTGVLTEMNFTPPIPAAKSGAYCPYLATADGRNNVAISLTPTNDLTVIGPTQLGVYSADSSGNLTTTSTYENMPKVAVGSIYAMSVSPSGELLAVAGQYGLQVFHFNGADPITRYTGLLTNEEISQISWDNDNHLYAISQTPGELFVFTVTPTNHGQGPGSPYAISGAMNLIVLPKP
jgi:hypothetical protein